jgi:hypothetical protein
MMPSQSWKSPPTSPTEAVDGAFSPLVPSPSSIDHFKTKPRIRARPRPKTPEYYTVYHACGYDTSCLLNPFDIVPTMKAKHPNKQKPPYLVILEAHVLKWHHLKILNTGFVEVYCTNTCCVLSPMDAAIYVDAIGGCASEDALLRLLHGFQERKSGGWYSDGSTSSENDSDGSDDSNSDDTENEHEKLETVSFRMIYRIPLAAFSPTFALEEKKSLSSNDSMDSCKVIKVPSWLWWYLDEKSENMGVCDLFSK